MTAEDSSYGLVLSTCPDAETAEAVAKALVEQRVAACVNVIPGLRSFFWWEGRVDSEQEQLLVAKTHRSRYPDVERAIRSQHPYELPEVVYVPIGTGLSDYLTWIASSVDVTP